MGLVFVDLYKGELKKLGCSSLYFTCELMLIYFGSFLIFLLIFSKNRKKHYLCQQNADKMFSQLSVIFLQGQDVI